MWTSTKPPVLGFLSIAALVGLFALSGARATEAQPVPAQTATLKNGKLTLTLDPGELAISGNFNFELNDKELVVGSEGCLDVKAENVPAGSYRLTSAAFAVCPKEGPAALRFAGGDLQIDGEIASFPIRLAEANGTMLLQGTFPATSFKGNATVGEDFVLKGQFGFEDGDLTYTDIARAGNVQITGNMLWSQTKQSVRSEIAGMHLADPNSPALFAPMRLQGQLAMTGQDLSWKIKASPYAGHASANAIGTMVGKHNLTSGKGTGDVRGTLDFQPDGLQPASISHLAPAMLEKTQGRVDYDLKLNWGRAFNGSGKISLAGLDLETEAATLSGIDGTIALASLSPLKTPGPQTFTIDKIDAGLELDKGAISFNLPGDDTVILQKAEWPFAEGSLSVKSTQPIRFDGKEQHLAVSMDHVAVAEIVKLIELPGLQGTGTLVGEVPVLIRDGSPIFQSGNITSTPEGGVIRYTGMVDDISQAGGEASILANALRNFHYEELSARLTGSPEDRTSNGNGVELALKLKGNNPDLYDGYPFEINIRTHGDLAKLVREGSIGFRPMDLIENHGVEDVQAPE